MSNQLTLETSALGARSMICSGLRFSVAGLAAYSVWAFGLTESGSAAGLYAACAAIFVFLGGIALYPDVRGRISFLRFCFLFAGGFVAFAAVWCLVYFFLKGKHGEILGFLFGIAAMVFVFQQAMKRKGSLLAAVSVAFTCHIAGYLAGDYLFYSVLLPAGWPVLGKLAWGFCHGFGFGAGLSWMFQEDGSQH